MIALYSVFFVEAGRTCLRLLSLAKPAKHYKTLQNITAKHSSSPPQCGLPFPRIHSSSLQAMWSAISKNGSTCLSLLSLAKPTKHYSKTFLLTTSMWSAISKNSFLLTTSMRSAISKNSFLLTTSNVVCHFQEFIPPHYQQCGLPFPRIHSTSPPAMWSPISKNCYELLPFQIMTSWFLIFHIQLIQFLFTTFLTHEP